MKYTDLKPGDLFFHRYTPSNYEWVVRFTETRSFGKNDFRVCGDYYIELNKGTVASYSTNYCNREEECEMRVPTQEEIDLFKEIFPNVEFTIPNSEPHYEIY